MNRHPLSAAWPDLDDADLADIAAHIKTHGQQEAITVFDGQVLDGWHRFMACVIAGVKPKTRQLPPGTDPVEFVIGKNAHRRHSSAVQRAEAVLTCYKWGESCKSLKGKVESGGGCKVAPPHTMPTTEEIARLSGTSERTVQYTKAAMRGAKKPTKPVPEKSSAKTILELESDLELARTRIETLEESLSDYALLQEQHAELMAIVDADDRLKAAAAAIQRLTETNRVLEERIRGLQGERNMAIKAARRK